MSKPKQDELQTDIIPIQYINKQQFYLYSTLDFMLKRCDYSIETGNQIFRKRKANILFHKNFTQEKKKTLVFFVVNKNLKNQSINQSIIHYNLYLIDYFQFRKKILSVNQFKSSNLLKKIIYSFIQQLPLSRTKFIYPVVKSFLTFQGLAQKVLDNLGKKNILVFLKIKAVNYIIILFIFIYLSNNYFRKFSQKKEVLDKFFLLKLLKRQIF
ncbi:transmembrane protein, putative (macronuclear) [Tetrahymena thermophila SB210]|uniref:Transmembrane protein, putative n=1 Tax=Tetrahymena thermophila (strain SB210) TaxID=312017 RepID=W7XLI2_TETTS|nr:transmembrane protein, putative [Tetrahymena thermophila SB210]EWS76334.1 transmembrane protein, putative [Tetrahymena thermophila SB210]|eukprot:XP_012651118.1 transmembrane protein, putative [Tetrahymena thermophila SB210]